MYCSYNVVVTFIYVLLVGLHLSSAHLITLSQTSDHFQNITRIRRQATCGESSMQCGSGECISDEVLCDGKEDCRDGSDETAELCKGVQCQSFLFKCKYGACINGDYECDGKKDCRDGSDETSPACTSSSTPRACGDDKFQCKSGQCIDDILLCDGKADCEDKSDETASSCSKVICPGYTYRCAYGACVSRDSRCNGVRDCFDGSDEVNCKPGSSTTKKPPTKKPPTPTTRPVSTSGPTSKPKPGSCQLPPYPENGQYTVIGDVSGRFKPGQYLEPHSIISPECRKMFKPDVNTQFLVCINGIWSPPVPKCRPICLSIKTTSTRTAKCRLGAMPLENCDDPPEGATAELICNALYEEPSLISNPFRRCKDGTWDYPITDCYPGCGKKPAKGQTNVIGGNKTVRGEFPWQAAIYRSQSKDHICGGSILNPRVILSAAHCFADYRGNKHPADKYLIRVGNYYRKFDHPEDVDVGQTAGVTEIHLSERYKGSDRNFESDIAVLILNVTLELTSFVRPVCVDWRSQFEVEQLQPNKKGFVIGWGYTVEGSAPSEELKVLEVPYIPDTQCFNEVPENFRPFLSLDKMCAGFLENGTSVCEGDSGGGLVFKREADQRFYIRGIVSASPRSIEKGSCDSNQYGAYTKISSHLDFIKHLEVDNRP